MKFTQSTRCPVCGAFYGIGYELTDGRCKICQFQLLLEANPT